VIVAVVFLAILLSAIFIDFKEIFSLEDVRRWLESFGILAPIVYIGIMTLAVIVTPIPSLPLSISAGLLFGPVPGTLYSVVGATIGAVACFFIARLVGRDIIERILRGRVYFFAQLSDKLLFKLILITRLIPLLSFDIISYGAGLTKISLWRFSIATFIGMIPLTFIYNYYGSIMKLDNKLTILIGFLFVVLFILFPYLIEKCNLCDLKKYLHQPAVE
jgi:uncharacterized membrane protein YdjX (TVP38/TMEM64 family)